MKNILFLLLSLLLFSCRNDKSDPAPTLLYPVEVIKTESYNNKVTTSKYSYDANRRLTREDILLDNTPDSYKLYDYDLNGKLTTIRTFNSQHIPQEENSLAYNASSFLERFSHAYIDAAGNRQPHHYRNFTYEVDGRISQVQDLSPAGILQKTLSISDESGGQVRIEERDANNTISLISISGYDGKKHPLAETGINFISQLRPGNELNNKLYDSADNELVSWTKNITYNAAGYPVKIVQTYSNGVIKTETYTYSGLN